MITELDKSFLGRIAEEDGMVNALEHYFTERAKMILPSKNGNETDEILGQKLRALNTANELIEEILRGLANYKGRKSNKNNPNLER